MLICFYHDGLTAVQKFLGLGISLALLSTVPAWGQEYDFSAVSNQFDVALSAYRSNVVVMVEQDDLGEIFRYEHGVITEDTKLAIASASKWLSGAIVLACVERGYFELDDSIGSHLPLFAELGKGDPTIRQCFAMTSGLSLEDPNYESDTALTLAESVDLIASNTPVIFTPGTMLDYQGDGMQVVGRICEVRSGMSWAELADELLFEPLEMTSADYEAFGSNPFIAGGARCSGADYMKFLRMIAHNGLGENGRVILSSRSVQEFFWNRTLGLPEQYSPWGLSAYYPNPLRRPDYSCGCWILATDAVSYRTLEVTSPGAFGVWPWVDRERKLVGLIVMFSLTGFGDTYDNNLHAIRLLREEVDRVGIPAPTDPGPLAISLLNNGYFSVSWEGVGVMNLSTNLTDWSPVQWMSSPVIEQAGRLESDALFYGVDFSK